MKIPQDNTPLSEVTGYVALCELLHSAKGKQSISVPSALLNEMLEAYEDMLDIVAYDEARSRIDAEEYFPAELVARLVEGEVPVRVYREYRRMTQQALADASGVSRDMIAMIETSKKNGSVATLKKLASALRIDLEDIVRGE